MKKCVILCGPTASGKSSLALSLAQRFCGSIVSADSMQIYRGMDIGTAKPTVEERALVPHELIDVCDPRDSFSVVQYQTLAKEALERVNREGRLPFLVGGTGLYIDSILYNTQFADIPENPRVRTSLEQEFDLLGGQALLERLTAVDPAQASKLSPADRKRIIRALEVYTVSGKTLTQFNAESRSYPSEYEFLTFVLNYRDRKRLYQRINQRVDQMMDMGLLAEAKVLVESGVSQTPTASQAIGYKELFGYLEGNSSLEDSLELLKRRSRNYAKRQITWFHRYGVEPLYMDEDNPLEQATQKIQRFLEG